MENNNRKKPDKLQWLGKSANRRELFSFFKTIFWLVILAGFLRASVVEAFKIPSESMKPTLVVGDHLLVTKFNYGMRLPFIVDSVIHYNMPRRGDIVVFTKEDDNPNGEATGKNINVIKRTIGLPGDTVEVRATRVYLNGQQLEENYSVRWEEGGIGDFGPIDVPSGHLFLLGDNRDRSRDSRFWDETFVNVRRLKGKAQIIYWNKGMLSRIGTKLR